MIVSGGLESGVTDDRLYSVSLTGDVSPIFHFDDNRASSPICDPSSGSLAFESNKGGGVHESTLWLLENGRARPLALESDGRPISGSLGGWSPTGGQVVFSQTEFCAAGCYGGDLSIVDTASGSVRALTEDSYTDREPTWSPDGSLIAFLSDRGDEPGNQVFVIQPDGTGLRQVTSVSDSLGFVREVAWGPGPHEITYQEAIPYVQDELIFHRFAPRILNVTTGVERTFPELNLADRIERDGRISWNDRGDQVTFLARRRRADSFLYTSTLVMHHDVRTATTRILVERQIPTLLLDVTTCNPTR